MLRRKRFRFVGAMFAVATLFTPLVAHAAGGFSKGRFHLLGRRRRVRRHSSDRAARWRPMCFRFPPRTARWTFAEDRAMRKLLQPDGPSTAR